MFVFCLTDSFHPKRRKTNNNSKAFGVESAEAEEHSLSLSQHSSPSQSDQEQTPAKKSTTTTTTTPLLLQQQNLTCCSLQNPKIAAPRPNQATCLDMLGNHSNPRRHDNTHFVAEELPLPLPLPFHSLVCALTKFDPVDIIAI